MVAPILVIFMTLAYGLWRLTMTEHRAFAQARDAAQQKAVRFLTLGMIDDPPDFIPDDRTPGVAPLPVLSGVNEATLRAYQSLPHHAAHAGGYDFLEQMEEISEDFGGTNVARDGMVLRPSWTFNGFPMVTTQHPDERDQVREWYYAALDATLPPDTLDALGVAE